jgi:transcriptional regulator with XRE-family HTH domain
MTPSVAKVLRIANGLTQQDVAKIIGVGVKQVSDFEKGEGDLEAEAFERLVSLFGFKAAKKLSPQSMAIVKRFKTHRQRCQSLEKHLGVAAAQEFHLAHKGNPGSQAAENEYEKLMRKN